MQPADTHLHGTFSDCGLSVASESRLDGCLSIKLSTLILRVQLSPESLMVSQPVWLLLSIKGTSHVWSFQLVY